MMTPAEDMLVTPMVLPLRSVMIRRVKIFDTLGAL